MNNIKQELESLYINSPELLPKSIAIIMDGNRRWAKNRGLPSIEGHRAAIEESRQLIKRAADLGVQNITLWVFSTENFKRDKEFLDDLFSLAREYLSTGRHFEEIQKMGGKLHLVGDVSRFPKDIAEGVYKFVKKSNPLENKINVFLAFGYGGRDELLRGIKRLAKEGLDAINNLTEESFYKFLDMPYDVDLVIRTGGHKRTSGLYPWQSAYAEYYFTDLLCPDFTTEELDKALWEFSSTVRNFGR